MKDITLYEQILGLTPPWKVNKVELDLKQRRVDIEVVCDAITWACPDCHAAMVIDHYEQRQWRHLDTCQFSTYIHCNVPYIKCDKHGAIVVPVPWAEKYSRFTRQFEAFAIDVLQICSISEASELLKISWDEADGIKQRAVKRGLSRKKRRVFEYVHVDEKGVGNGQDYLTVVCATRRGKTHVEFLADGADKAALDKFWGQLTPRQLRFIKGVTMDMSEAYIQSTMEHLPKADKKIIHDIYHIIAHMNDAVNTVRRQEHKALQAHGDEVLDKSRFLWLYGAENIPERHEARFEALRPLHLKTGRAWAIKEMLRDWWKQSSKEAGEYFKNWYSWAIRCRLAPVKKVARMIKSHLIHVMNYFSHRITNAQAEGINNLIQGLIKKAFGYRNKARLKTDILFHFGGLDLHPETL